MLAKVFEFVMGILGDAGADAEAVSIVEKVFDFIVSLFTA